MDWSYPILMLIQLVIAVLAGAVAAYMGVVLFDRATRGIDEWAELAQGNQAIGIVLGAIVVAVAWVIRPARLDQRRRVRAVSGSGNPTQ